MLDLDRIIEVLDAHKRRYNRSWTIETRDSCIVITNIAHQGVCTIFEEDIRMLAGFMSTGCSARIECAIPKTTIMIIPRRESKEIVGRPTRKW